MRLLAGFGVMLIGGAAIPAAAVPITYIFNGTASGSLGGIAFSDAAVGFSLTTDTDTVFQPFSSRPNILITGNAPIVFSVGSINGTIDGGGNVFVNNDRGARSAVGLKPETGSDLFDVSALSLARYDLRSAFGPLAPAFPSFLNFGEIFATSAGKFVLADDPDTRFAADVVNTLIAQVA